MKHQGSKAKSHRAAANPNTTTAAHSHPARKHPSDKPWGDVVGVPPNKAKKRRRSAAADRQSDKPDDQRLKVFGQNDPVFHWNENDAAAENYARLGERLATTGDLFRSPQYGSGLILLLPNGKPARIEHGMDLLPVIVDRVPVQIIRDGKPKGGRIAAAHLGAMLKSESFLGNFRSVDRISTHPGLAKYPDYSSMFTRHRCQETLK
jgi:hypothetical protein